MKPEQNCIKLDFVPLVVKITIKGSAKVLPLLSSLMTLLNTLLLNYGPVTNLIYYCMFIIL